MKGGVTITDVTTGNGITATPPAPEMVAVGDCEITGAYIKVPSGSRTLMLHITDVKALLDREADLRSFLDHLQI